MKQILVILGLATASAIAAPAPNKVDCTRNYLAVDGSKQSLILERNAPGQNSWTVTVSFVTGGLRPQPSTTPEKGETVLTRAATCEFLSLTPLQAKCQDRAASPTFELSTSLVQNTLGKLVRVSVKGAAITDLAQKGELPYYGMFLRPGSDEAFALFSVTPSTGSATVNRCVAN